VPETSLAVNRTVRGVGERALQPPPYWEDCERTVMVANRTRESRPSGMKRGAHGNVMHDLMTICHEAGNSGYLGSHRSKHARAAFLFRLYYSYHRPGQGALLPGARELTLKLVAESVSGRLLGAQAVGLGAVDKMIDIAATALLRGLSCRDLENADLAYAPPFSPVLSPIISSDA
jgi:hypothetical protein